MNINLVYTAGLIAAGTRYRLITVSTQCAKIDRWIDIIVSDIIASVSTTLREGYAIIGLAGVGVWSYSQ